MKHKKVLRDGTHCVGTYTNKIATGICNTAVKT